ncbi:hypothetical protein AB0C61_16285 [Streptomyces sp. NPDC048680]|uniref:hypothetical protein n=1 Tax=Streptomyces sp. NPDC048680 TaxID=3155492 RepID=UPI003414AE8B
MSGPGRRAALPPQDYRRTPVVDETGLVVSPTGQAGEPLGVFDFNALPGPESLRRELAGGFAARARRKWTSESTCRTHFKALGVFAREAARRDPPLESLDRLGSAEWKAFRQAYKGAGGKIPVVLLETGRLSAKAKTAVESRGKKTPKAKNKRTLTRPELRMVRDAAARTVRSAVLRIEDNRRQLARWREGEGPQDTPQWRHGQMLDHLSRTADLPRHPCGQLNHLSKAAVKGEGFAGFVARLFPTPHEMGAAAVLLICYDAWNLSPLQKMQVPDFWPNGDGDSEEPAIQRVETDKPRRGRRRHQSNNLVDTGEMSAGWAMRQVIEMTRQCRETLAELGRPTSSLLLARRILPGTSTTGIFADGRSLEFSIYSWVKKTAGNDGTFPTGVNASRVRHSVQVVHGGARNNTPQVHHDIYVMRDETVRDEAADVVAQGLAEAVTAARAQVRITMVEQVMGSSEEDAEVLAGQVGLPLETARAAVSGRLDTVASACTDFEHSPFTPSGPCSVSFLMCFACPNALATGRHLPRIVYLFQSLDSLRSVVGAEAWRTDWLEHHARVGDLLDKHTTADRWPALLAKLTTRDKELVDRVLERRLDP